MAVNIFFAIKINEFIFIYIKAKYILSTPLRNILQVSLKFHHNVYTRDSTNFAIVDAIDTPPSVVLNDALRTRLKFILNKHVFHKSGKVPLKDMLKMRQREQAKDCAQLWNSIRTNALVLIYMQKSNI